MINGNAVGGITGYGKTFILEDENGNQFTGVVVSEETVFTADAATDIREGKVAATDAGVVTGAKVIPAYHTYQGYRIVTNGSLLELKNTDVVINNYDYTKLQAIVCSFNTSIADSVSAQQTVIDDNLYNVQSVESISVIIKNHESKTIDFGVNNDTGNPVIIRFLMYKEVI